MNTIASRVAQLLTRGYHVSLPGVSQLGSLRGLHLSASDSTSCCRCPCSSCHAGRCCAADGTVQAAARYSTSSSSVTTLPHHFHPSTPKEADEPSAGPCPLSAAPGTSTESATQALASSLRSFVWECSHPPQGLASLSHLPVAAAMAYGASSHFHSSPLTLHTPLGPVDMMATPCDTPGSLDTPLSAARHLGTEPEPFEAEYDEDEFEDGEFEDFGEWDEYDEFQDEDEYEFDDEEEEEEEEVKEEVKEGQEKGL